MIVVHQRENDVQQNGLVCGYGPETGTARFFYLGGIPLFLRGEGTMLVEKQKRLELRPDCSPDEPFVGGLASRAFHEDQLLQPAHSDLHWPTGL